jgi:hypothetical protein
MDLSDLRTSLSNLTEAELMETLRNIRTNRRAKPQAARAVKPGAKATKESEVNLETMSQDSLAALIAQLEGRK